MHLIWLARVEHEGERVEVLQAVVPVEEIGVVALALAVPLFDSTIAEFRHKEEGKKELEDRIRPPGVLPVDHPGQAVSFHQQVVRPEVAVAECGSGKRRLGVDQPPVRSVLERGRVAESPVCRIEHIAGGLAGAKLRDRLAGGSSTPMAWSAHAVSM